MGPMEGKNSLIVFYLFLVTILLREFCPPLAPCIVILTPHVKHHLETLEVQNDRGGLQWVEVRKCSRIYRTKS